jgi:hypothetical protein
MQHLQAPVSVYEKAYTTFPHYSALKRCKILSHYDLWGAFNLWAGAVDWMPTWSDSRIVIFHPQI